VIRTVRVKMTQHKLVKTKVENPPLFRTHTHTLTHVQIPVEFSRTAKLRRMCTKSSRSSLENCLSLSHTHTHINTHTYVQVHVTVIRKVEVEKIVHTIVRRNADIFSHTHAHTRARARTHTHTHTHTHTRTHTHTLTYVQVPVEVIRTVGVEQIVRETC